MPRSVSEENKKSLSAMRNACTASSVTEITPTKGAAAGAAKVVRVTEDPSSGQEPRWPWKGNLVQLCPLCDPLKSIRV